MPHSPELDDFAVTRTDAGYSYSLPRARREGGAHSGCAAWAGRRASTAAGGIEGASRRPPYPADSRVSRARNPLSILAVG